MKGVKDLSFTIPSLTSRFPNALPKFQGIDHGVPFQRSFLGLGQQGRGSDTEGFCRVSTSLPLPCCRRNTRAGKAGMTTETRRKYTVKMLSFVLNRVTWVLSS